MDSPLDAKMIRKAVIPAAGFGTRFLPVTKVVPKELLPFGAKPVIHHVVEEAKAAGCTEIGIILSKGKESIQQYFEADPVLNAFLDKNNKRSFLQSWEELVDGLRFSWLDQAEQKGLGDAVLCARDFAQGEPFCLLLGDTIIHGQSPLSQMAASVAKTHVSAVAVQAIAAEKATKYGVTGGKEVARGHYSLDTMAEKPAPSEVPMMTLLDGSASENAYAVCARYAFTADIFEELTQTQPGKGGEIQLTDAMAALLRKNGFDAFLCSGKRLDIGSAEGLKEAFVHYL